MTVNPLSYKVVVTVPFHGIATAKHLDCQSLSQLIPLQTTVFLLSGYSHSVLGSLLMVVSQLGTLTVPSPDRPVRKGLMVKEENDSEPVDAIPPSA